MSRLINSKYGDVTLQIGASALIGYLCPSAILVAGALGALAPHTVHGARHIWDRWLKDLF